MALLVAIMAILGLLLVGYLRPLPSYLVAARDLLPGETLSEGDFVSVEADLGQLGTSYLVKLEPGLSPSTVLRSGELIPLSRLARDVGNRTQLRFTPSLETASTVKPGTWVSLWQVIEGDQGYEPQLLVPRSEVAAVIEPEGLFASEVPAIEVLVSQEQSTLVLTAIAADYEIFVVPVR